MDTVNRGSEGNGGTGEKWIGRFRQKTDGLTDKHTKTETGELSIMVSCTFMCFVCNVI